MARIISGFFCGLIVAVNVWAAPAEIYGPTTPSDTAWGIAIRLRPSTEVTISQVVLGILSSNQHAFYANNINALDVGQTIKAPDLNTIKRISVAAAEKEVIRQNRMWQQDLKNPHKVKVKAKSKVKTVAKKNKAVVEPKKDLTSGEESPKLDAPAPNGASKTEDPMSGDLAASNAKMLPESVATANLPQANSPQPEPASLTPTAAMPQISNLPADQRLVVAGNNFVVTNATDDGNLAINNLNDHLNAVVESNVAPSKIPETNEIMDVVEKHVTGPNVLKQNIFTFFSSNKYFVQVQQYADQLHDSLGSALYLATLSGIILVLLLILIYIILPRHKNIPPGTSQDDASAEKEISITEGKEGVAAKFNLARAYIEMGEDDKAKAILIELLLHGNDAEQEEAKSLIDTIKYKKL